MGSALSLNMFNSIYAKSAVVDFGVQWALSVVAILLRTEKFYDLAGSSTFAFLAWQMLFWGGRFHPRQVVQSGCITAWSARLGLYLFKRVLQDGGDSRFKYARNSPTRFFLFWTMQALWVYITLLPTMMLHSSKRDRPLTLKDYLGWGIWALGFCIESVADYQKSQFRSDPQNHKQFITTGLWSIVRYPNYLGEIMMWFGLFLPATSVMSGWQHLSVLSPLFVSFLLTKVSGIPLQEAQAKRRWSNNPAFQSYQKNTARLIPGLW